MTDYGDTTPAAVVARLCGAAAHDRVLDVLVWLHAGSTFGGPDGWLRGEAVSPNEAVCGRTMPQAIALGLGGIDSAFNVPPVTSDLGAAHAIARARLGDPLIEIRTGGGGFSRAMLVPKGGPPSLAHSRLSAAAAVCAALLKALHPERTTAVDPTEWR
jgi:hypothetical protein